MPTSDVELAPGEEFELRIAPVAKHNLVWKDTALIITGETVDLLLEVTNLGRWMAHCRIAEHHESGMLLSFEAKP